MCYNKHMNNKEYLEKIAKDNRAAGVQKKKFLGLEITPNMKKLFIGGAILVVVMMVIGMILGSGDKNVERDYVDKVYLRANNLLAETGNYTKLVKSSQLRSMGNSLNAVLTETKYAIGNSLKEDFGAKSLDKPNKEKTETDEDAIMVEYLNTLESGRLNGILDRVYTRELAYQIGMLISIEHDAYSRTKKTNLRSALDTSMTNLDKLYDQFNNFVAE